MAGSNEMPIKSSEIVPAEKSLSVTVGMLELVAGERVPTVRSMGPILIGKTLVQYLRLHQLARVVYSPEDTVDPIVSCRLEEQVFNKLNVCIVERRPTVDATPIDCSFMTTLSPRVTVSVYS